MLFDMFKMSSVLSDEIRCDGAGSDLLSFCMLAISLSPFVFSCSHLRNPTI